VIRGGDLSDRAGCRISIAIAPISQISQLVHMTRHGRVLERRWFAIVYGGSALLLVPWIAFLWFSQPQLGTEHIGLS
jgi:hypothetical protein